MRTSVSFSRKLAAGLTVLLALSNTSAILAVHAESEETTPDETAEVQREETVQEKEQISEESTAAEEVPAEEKETEEPSVSVGEDSEYKVTAAEDQPAENEEKTTESKAETETVTEQTEQPEEEKEAEQAEPAAETVKEDTTAETKAEKEPAEIEETAAETENKEETAETEETAEEITETEPEEEKEAGTGTKKLMSPRRAPTANAAAVYVSNTGDDENGDGTEENPFATIARAYEAAASGATIYLLSDIEQGKYVYIKHDLTIDGQGHTITRAEGFATASDTGRSWYNPAMFELHPDNTDVTVTFKNVTIDEAFKHEGGTYKFQAAGSDTGDNLNRVQDGIISAYYAGGTYKATIILDNGTSLKNFGGMTAVRVQGNCELIMNEGSVIDNGGERKTSVPDNSPEAGAVTTQAGIFTMHNGAKITGIKGVNSITSNSGTIYVDGEISNCNSGAMIRPMGLTHLTLGKNCDIHDVTTSLCVIYGNGCAPGTVFDIDGKIHDVSCGPKRGGIWPSNSGSNITVNITENAEFYNIPGQVIRSDLGATINMSGGKIHDCGAALFIRKGATCNITGGEIKNNRFGVLLANDGTNVARINVNTAAQTVEGNQYDYFIDYSELGYKNGSYMYLSPEKLAETPMVVLGDMNADDYRAEVSETKNFKEITIPASNGFMYLGNASKASKETLKAEAARLELTNERATWWFAHNSSEAVFDVAKLPGLTDEPLYALYVPVDADGKTAEGAKVMCTPVTVENGVAKVKLSAEAAENGYSVMLAQAEPPVFNIKIEYLNKKTHEPIKDAYEEGYVKGSNYDVTSFAKETIEGYDFESTDEELVKGEDLQAEITIKSYYIKQKQNIEPSVAIDDWTYGEDASEPAVDGNPGDGEVTYTYYAADEEGNPVGEPLEGKPSEAGKYVVKADVAATEEYNAGSAQTAFEVKPAVITFASENADYGTVTVESAEIGKASDEAKSEAVPQTGYHFVNWTDDNDSDKEVSTSAEFSPEKKAGAYTAHFAVDTFNVTFDTDGGEPVPEKQEVNYGENSTKPEEEPAKDEYTFVDWYEVVDGEMSDSAFDFGTAIEHDTVLKAKYELQPFSYSYTATTPLWVKDSGVPADFTVKRSINDQFTFPRFTEILVDGTKVDSSNYTAKAGSVELTLNADYLQTLDVGTHTLTTNFTDGTVDTEFEVVDKETVIHTVTFDSAGGTEVAKQQVEDGKTATEPTAPTKEGYTFDGWYLNGMKYNFSTPVTKDIVLKAKWTAVTPVKPTAKPEEPKKPANNTGRRTVVPNTGDGSNMYFWLLMLIISAAGGLGSMLVLKTKTR